MERLMKLLGLEMEIAGRVDHAKDHEGFPHKDIRRASVDEISELLEVHTGKKFVRFSTPTFLHLGPTARFRTYQLLNRFMRWRVSKLR